MPARDRGALVLGTVSGASAWISLGALAVTSDQLARVGVLPPLWALGACLVVGFLAAWITRLRTDEAWPLALTLLLWLPWLPLPILSGAHDLGGTTRAAGLDCRARRCGVRPLVARDPMVHVDGESASRPARARCRDVRAVAGDGCRTEDGSLGVTSRTI